MLAVGVRCLAVDECQSVECAFTSPVIIESGMLVMYCMQLVCLYLWCLWCPGVVMWCF